MRRFSHLTWTNRLRIEDLRKEGHSPREIANILHVHISTIYRELKRGTYTHLNMDWTEEVRYSPDIAQAAYEANLSAKGPDLKIGKDNELCEYIERRIADDHLSPDAVIGEIRAKKKQFDTSICKTTVYSYIRKGVFLRLTMDALPMHGKARKKKYEHIKAAKAPKGESIENRPPEVAARNSFGHWEMDTVYGKKGGGKAALLVLTERLTRREIIRKMKDRTTQSVIKAINRIERKMGAAFRKIFKTITVDNGSEFADWEGIQASVVQEGDRTILYFCHPYSSYERGTNENINRMIRRIFPKGTNFNKVTNEAVSKAEAWINDYPRPILGYRTASEIFTAELQAIGLSNIVLQ